MTLDSYTTSAVVDELNLILAGGKVQDTVEITRESFGLEIYANQERHYLLISADNEQPRAMLTPDKLRRGVQNPSPLALLLRNRVEGMRIMAIEQPPWERIIIFNLMNAEGELKLILELIERRANIILVDNGMILDSARRVDGDDNRYRLILPRHQYITPPPIEGKIQFKYPLDPSLLDRLLRKDGTQALWQTLNKQVLGFSPLLAKEVAFRVSKDTKTPASEINPYTLKATLESLMPPLQRRAWQPGVGYDADGRPIALSVYPLTHVAKWTPFKSISEAINAYYGVMEGAAVYDAGKDTIRKQLLDAREKLRRKLYSLENQLRDASEVEFLRHSGELILAYQYNIQDGQTLLEEQYDPEGEPLKIKLNPELTPLENAQAYFEKYDKAKRGRAAIPQQVEATREEIDFLDQLDADLDFAENWTDIGEVQDELQKKGYWKGPKTARPQAGKSAPLKFTVDGFVIWVGRNSRQNEEVTFGKASLEDIWMHARDSAGSHVVVKTNGKQVPEPVLEKAAAMAAYYSKLRNDSKVWVMVAERRYIQKPKHGRMGQVLVRQELSSILAKPKPDVG